MCVSVFGAGVRLHFDEIDGAVHATLELGHVRIEGKLTVQELEHVVPVLYTAL